MTPQFFTHFMMVPSLADLRPIMRASYRQIHHHFSEQHAISASHEMRALIMINSGSRSHSPDHGLVILQKTYLTEQMRKWPVMMLAMSQPVRRKSNILILLVTTQFNMFVISTPHSCKDFNNLSQHKCVSLIIKRFLFSQMIDNINFWFMYSSVNF